MKKSLFATVLLALTACLFPKEVDVSWGPAPWYTYCSWDAPCWYGPSLVYVNGWGYIDRPTYVVLRSNARRREAWEHRRRDWHPRKRPEYRGREWHADQHDGGHDKDHGDRQDHNRDRKH